MTYKFGASGNITPPSQAVNAGYSSLIFDDEFDDSTTIAPTSPKNLTLNSAFKGADISSNTLPSKMGGYVGSPSYATLVGTGKVNGVPYIDIKWNGTVSNGYTLGVFLTDQSASVSATQAITSSVYVQLIAGATTNLSNFKLEMDASDSGFGGGGLTGTSSWNQTFTPSSTNSRVSITGTMPTGAAHAYPTFFMNGNGAINITLRFSGLQIEVGSSATTYQETPLTDYNWYQCNPALPNGGYSVANSILTINTDTGGAGAGLQSVFNFYDNLPNKGIFQHAYFEAKIKFDPSLYSGSGDWPAFWTRSLELVSSGGTGTELDIMEYYAQGSSWPSSPPVYATTLHEWVSNSNTQNSNTTPTLSGVNWSDWHTYGCLWTPNMVQWYFDNQLVTTVPCGPGTSFPSIETNHLFLILGTGFNWPCQFDWVRVWGAKGTSVGKVDQLQNVYSGSSYAVQSSEYLINVNKTSGSATSITLPEAPVIGRSVMVVDGKGDATTNNITIYPTAGTINGSSSYVISSNYGYAEFKAVNSGWIVTGASSSSSYNAASVAITGGSINNTTIGAVTPSTAVVSNLNVNGNITLNGTVFAKISAGTGAPSGTQPAGSLYLRTDGSAGTHIYVSQGGGTWTAIASV